MAYSDYGAFVWRNGTRRLDKEDVGVYDTDEGALPSGMRIFANIRKNTDRGSDEWWQHSQHGVMGDGPVRVACYKQGLSSTGIYVWQEGAEKPERLDWVKIGFFSSKDDQYANYYDYGSLGHYVEFGGGRYDITFEDKERSRSGHYEATMTEPDGTHWRCIYDYGYGAGLTDADDTAEERAGRKEP